MAVVTHAEQHKVVPLRDWRQLRAGDVGTCCRGWSLILERNEMRSIRSGSSEQRLPQHCRVGIHGLFIDPAFDEPIVLLDASGLVIVTKARNRSIDESASQSSRTSKLSVPLTAPPLSISELDKRGNILRIGLAIKASQDLAADLTELVNPLNGPRQPQLWIRSAWVNSMRSMDM